MDRPTFIDIDGTLTDDSKAGGKAIHARVKAVRKMIAAGDDIVIWSGTGTKYAVEFCNRYSIKPLAAIGKPELCVDDNPTIRPVGHVVVLDPKEFFE